MVNNLLPVSRGLLPVFGSICGVLGSPGPQALGWSLALTCRFKDLSGALGSEPWDEDP